MKNTSVALSAFPYIIACLPLDALVLSHLQQCKFVSLLLAQFLYAGQKQIEVDNQVQDEMQVRQLQVQFQRQYITKSSPLQSAAVSTPELELLAHVSRQTYLFSVQMLLQMMQCLSVIQQSSVHGGALLVQNDLLQHLAGCEFFKSTKFALPYLEDGEENPRHELWCNCINLVTDLLRRMACASKRMWRKRQREQERPQWDTTMYQSGDRTKYNVRAFSETSSSPDPVLMPLDFQFFSKFFNDVAKFYLAYHSQILAFFLKMASNEGIFFFSILLFFFFLNLHSLLQTKCFFFFLSDIEWGNRTNLEALTIDWTIYNGYKY
ncbi:hypothetical protein RFI_18415 [Reticulomyxa filosa]|uniref:Uncharacterized protein n=1 Tax=Reticulomyxa filosa TaxID=46433 RepID=X6MYD5_RETFI|nr:hypothetical protein RFI_18415 [Reticulomyxa filosa]|eukprot:ETO18831.1 hypothetical protein RFI_18415 [Reticulomyxa filosa]